MTWKPWLFALTVCGVLFAADPPIERATLDAWMKELSNWVRWGKDDQLGTVNLITPAKRKAAAALVREGVAGSLSCAAETVKAADNDFPFEQQMVETGSSANPMFAVDVYRTRYHGKVLTP